MAAVCARDAPPSQTDRARQEVLSFIASGGRHALREMAQVSGHTEADLSNFLSRGSGATASTLWIPGARGASEYTAHGFSCDSG